MDANFDKKNIKLPEKSESFWIASTPETNYPSLGEDMAVDVAILGGGIVGITAAFLLGREGLKVAVIEADRIVKGVTGYTTAHITAAHGPIFSYLSEKVSAESAEIYAEANFRAIDEIETLVNKQNIDCDFKRTNEYIYAENESDIEELQNEFSTVKDLKINASYLDAAPLPFKTYGVAVYPNQAQFHPRKYVMALARLVNGEGGFIFEKTRALDVKEGKTCIVKTDKGDVMAKNVIVATHFPFLNKGMFYTKMIPWMSYVIGIRVKDEIPEEMFDAGKGEPDHNSHYIRTQKDKKGTLVLLGNEDHIVGRNNNTLKNYEMLANFARNNFQLESIDYRWSTQDNYAFDFIPFIGRFPRSKNMYLATGFHGWGMTHSMVSAILFRDLIVGSENPWEKLYNPSRKTPQSWVKMAKENMNIAGELVKRKILKTEKPADEIDRMNPGEGEIIKIGRKKVAAYKGEKGEVHALSPVCQHLGCAVGFNKAEKTWDCPCHGSRYNYDGTVLHGPAINDLPMEDIVPGEVEIEVD